MSIGWRICIGRKTARAWLVRPLFQSGDTSPCMVAPGLPIPKANLHVGTSRQFCLDYYAGCCHLNAGDHELLLKLDCAGKAIDQEHQERFGCPCPTEALVSMPIVLDIEVLAAG